MAMKAYACPRCLTLSSTTEDGDGGVHTCTPTPLVRGLEGRIAELEAGMESLLRAHPSVLECNDFNHAPKDRHEGFDCPCKARWDTAVEAACNLLKR